jgi:hypothetical protein
VYRAKVKSVVKSVYRAKVKSVVKSVYRAKVEDSRATGLSKLR